MTSKRVRSSIVTTRKNRVFNLSPLSLAIRTSIVGIGLAHGATQAATITVNSTADDGTDCTLREAIASANISTDQDNGCQTGGRFGADTITFSNRLTSNTITLTGGQLAINNKNIVIDAISTPGGITVDANNASRVFSIDSSTLTLDNLSVKGGLAVGSGDDGRGGGIFAGNSSNISLNNSTVSANSATNAGGIHSRSGSIVSLSNSTVRSNSASYGGGIVADYNGSVNLSNSTVSGNSSSYAAGGIAVFGSSVSLSNSTVSDNSVDGGTGGGIYARGYGSVSLSNTTVSGNSAGSGGGVSARRASSIGISNSTVSNNSAVSGGGLEASGYSSISLSKSTVSGNSASEEGGGIAISYGTTVSLENSTVSGNSANTAGGGINVNDDGFLNLINSTVSHNWALDAGGGLNFSNSSNALLNNSIVANSLMSADCSRSTDFSGYVAIDSAGIIEDATCFSFRSGDPGLLPLADNGGSTKTHALKSSSIARNTESSFDCPIDDQRGQLRDDGDGLCDIGAIEFNPNDDDSGFFVIPLGNGKVVVVPL